MATAVIIIPPLIIVTVRDVYPMGRTAIRMWIAAIPASTAGLIG